MTTIIILGLVGIAAVIAELFIPGGIIGIIGAACIVGAIVTTFVQFGMLAGLIALIGFTVLGLIMLALWMKYFDRLPVTRNFILKNKVGDEEEPDPRHALIGQTGTALTDLMPSGRAQFGDEKYDVLSQGPSVEKGQAVEAIGLSGASVIVKTTTGTNLLSGSK